jgi:hypothetical protein
MPKDTHQTVEDVLGQLQSVFNGGEPFTPAQAASALGCSKKLANARLISLARKGMIQQPAHGCYCLDEEDEKIVLVFKFDDRDPEHRDWVQRIMAEKADKRRMNQWQKHVCRS